MKPNPTGSSACKNPSVSVSRGEEPSVVCPPPRSRASDLGQARGRRQTPTFLPLEFALTLLVDEAGSQSAEEDGGRQEADGGHDPSQHRPGQPIVGQVRLREDVCKEGQEHP